MSDRLLHVKRCTVALAIVAALALIAIAWSAPSLERAFASDEPTSAQAAETKTPSNGMMCGIASVKKSYPTNKTMIVTMAGGDATTVSTTNVGSKVKWTTSNNKIVKVTSTGKHTAKITALRPGTTTVLAKSDYQTVTCKVTVTGMLNKRSVVLTPLQTSQLKLQGAMAKSWRSSNTKVVNVARGGLLTPKTTGKATITCTDKAGYRYTCTVKVQKPRITCKAKALPATLHKNFSFTLTNRTGKRIALNTNVLYYPSTRSNANVVLRTFSKSGARLSERPLSVQSAKTAKFTGRSSTSVSLLGSGYLKLGFKVGKAQYLAMFSPKTGTILACGRI